MARLLLFAIIAVVGLIVTLFKKSAGAVTSNAEWERANLKDETSKVMTSTAKGLSWMDEQWQEATQAAEDEKKKLP
jgi:hypothetical protein